MTLAQHETREACFPLELRNAESLQDERLMTLLLVPYGEVSMLTKYPKGERFLKGAFRKAASEFRGRRRDLYLFRSHQHDRAVRNSSARCRGAIRSWREGGTGGDSR